jgi:ComF family protein
MTNTLLQGFSHLFYPRLCTSCSKPLLPEEEILCLNCNIYLLPRTAYHHIPENETAMRLAGRIPFVKATSFVYFIAEGLVQHLLHELKYNNKEEIGLYLGKQFGYDLQQVNWASEIDMILPVPLFADKEKSRGFNQSTIIADGMAEVLDIPVNTTILKRIKNTETQTQKTREERLLNVKDAFIAANTDLLEGKHVLILDDVLTTGATIEACVQALLHIPDIRVSIATLAIAT